MCHVDTSRIEAFLVVTGKVEKYQLCLRQYYSTFYVQAVIRDVLMVGFIVNLSPSLTWVVLKQCFQ